MPARYFTIEEANALIPQIEPLIERLLERRARIIESRDRLSNILSSEQSDIGGPEASNIVQDFIAIERLARKIRSYGCILKDVNNGLVDFLSIRNGREIYLCWRFGEPRVAFYHELHTGFQGRHPV